ncbi:MAG: DNA double-strand break repair nuclease NurA [Chloroflexota bacterium]
MALDLNKVAPQIGGMVARLKADRDEKEKRLRYALGVASNEAIDLDRLKKKVRQSKTTWLVADLVEGIANHYPAPPTPTDFTVLATDGSHIDVDRHRSTRCYLINIGAAVLHYGSRPDATLASYPALYSQAEDLVIAAPDGKAREQMIEGNLLGIKRAVEETCRLAKLASELPRGSASLALLDGSLILWGLEAYPEFVAEAMLEQGLLPCLNELKKLNKPNELNELNKLALASYISFPRSTDVVNVLRVAICPYEPADCDRHCAEKKEKDCAGVAGVQDREVFGQLLKEEERSAVFISQSSVTRHYGEHLVYFFYLKAGEEIARVEVPRWVGENGELLELAHALILDQCRRGQGYPVALSEAHEQAVVTGTDRDNFWQLVESECVEEKMTTMTSAKSLSKRMRWV